MLVSAGMGWGWRVVKGGHTGTTLYLTASLLSHKTASPGNVTHTAWKVSFLCP